MNTDELLSELTANERKVLPCLLKESESGKIASMAGLQDIEVQRAFMWLSNKGLVKPSKEEKEFLLLDENGLAALKKGLPEKRFLSQLTKGPKKLKELEKELSKEEINISIGTLKKNKLIDVEAEKEGPIFTLNEAGREYLKIESPEEKFLKLDFPVQPESLEPEMLKVLSDFQKRKNIVKKERQVTWRAELTEAGRDVAAQKDKLAESFAEQLTPKMIKSGEWKNANFRSYDVNSKVPSIGGGKKHFVNEAIEYIRSIWLELGFEEMEGNHVQSAFWDMDALFVPQDHPAREMQDTFYIEGKAKLPVALLRKVRQVHENGADTGSKGWQSKYSEDVASEILLRTHTTVISAQKLSQLKISDLPKRYFVVGKTYRNEALDWKHLFEFNQVEGIVVDPSASLATLKGYLKEFFLKMGYPDVRIRPGHFPYTEPSAEIEVFHPVKKQWVEMGGCGIFRPEVTKTLMGMEIPVLAWGIGMERIITAYYEITDLRDLYNSNIEFIKDAKLFIK